MTVCSGVSARAILALVCVLGLLGARPGPAHAEERQLFLLVTQSGQPVLDLAPDDVMVEQNGAACDVRSVAPETDKMRIVLLVDNSEGARYSQIPLRAGLSDFLETLPAQHEIALYTIANQVRLRTDFTADRMELQEQVDNIFIERGASAVMINGLVQAWDRGFDDEAAWPVFVLVVHDGPEASRRMSDERYIDFVNELAVRAATVHAISVSGGLGGVQRDYSMNLTENLGGVYNALAIASGLRKALTDLATEMGKRYDDIKDRHRVVFECDDDAGSMTLQVRGEAIEFQAFFNRSPAP